MCFGTPVLKHVGVDTYHELYFMVVFCCVHLLVTVLSTCAVAVWLQIKKEIQCTV